MKKNQLSIFSNRTIPFLLALVILILILSAFFEYNSRKKSVLTLMSHMSRNLANSIEAATVNAILNYDTIEEETARRMMTTLQMIRHLDTETGVKEPQLKKLAEEYDLYKVKIIKSVTDRFPFLNNYPEEYYGFQFIPEVPMEVFVVALRNPNGGYYLAMIEAAELTEIRQKTGIAPLINSLVADSSIQYIAIQDTMGILAATHNVATLSAISQDDFLQNAWTTRTFQYRKKYFKRQAVYESVAPFVVAGTDYGLIRIGINYQPLAELNQTAIRNALVRMGISGLILLFIFAYSLMVQKLSVINEEKDRITAEVYRLQEDIRRKEKLTAMGELAAGVAHEIRNPLNAISMAVQRLGKRLPIDTNSKEKRLVQSIRSEINRVGKIIHQFLDFARPPQLNRNRTDLNQLVTEILDVYRAQLASADITPEWRPGNIPPLQLDREKIKQVIINLLENSINAIPESGEIFISTAKEKESVILKIKDTGVGIAEENLPKIFNLYFTTRPEGNGLGLAEVAQIIANHNGTIDVISNINDYTKFIIQLPGE